MKLVHSFISIAESAAKQQTGQLTASSTLKLQKQPEKIAQLPHSSGAYLLERRVGER